MLSHLQIRNFAIIPGLSQDFSDGFTTITGETGAGKSMLVDALGLLLGERSDASWVRSGEDRAELTAEFALADNAEALAWLEEADLATGGECLLRRTISANGRSRAYINGTAVTLAQLQALGDLLVEIHGQNEHLKLKQKSEQFTLLDGSGDYAEAVETVRMAYAEWHAVSREIQALDREALMPAGDFEILEFQLAELQQHELEAGAIAALQAEHDRLAAGGDLLEALNRGIETLEPESAEESEGVNSSLHGSLDELKQFSELDSGIGEACQMLEEAAVNCSEAVSALRAARDQLDLDPARLEAVAARLGQLYDLARKHRVKMDELFEVREDLATRIERLGDAGRHRRQLEKRLGQCLARYREAASELHARRKQHAAAVSGRVRALMEQLGMEGGAFDWAVTHVPQAPPTSRGDDELEINLSANPGTPPGPLAKIASGGELSRISLAIKVATAGGGDAVTQIFDEVDAGIGGEAANAVGRLIRQLSMQRGSGKGQALCVTHLAQVAVCATHQLLVRKLAKDDTVAVETRLLNATNRVDEIARMLSGKVSEQSRAHAAELLAAANMAEQG